MTTITEDKPRTSAQNRALHLYLTQLADALNEAGLEMRVVLKPEVEIPWNCMSAKEHLWKPVLKAMQNKDSTTEMTTVDPTEIKRVIDRHLAERFGFVSPDWPSLR